MTRVYLYAQSKWDYYYSEGGLYDQRHELAVLPQGAAGPTDKAKDGTDKDSKAVAANPGHLLMCGHALVLGSVVATCNLLHSGRLEAWAQDFNDTAKEAAKTGSPVGGFIMREHILKEREEQVAQ